MQKCQISIFIFDPPSGSPFGEALVPLRETSNQKMYRDKKFLEFNFKGGQFYAESPKSKICITPQILGGP